MELVIPMVDRAFWQVDQVPQIKDKLRSIQQQFGGFINRAATLTGVRPELVTSVIFIESAGKASVVSAAGAVGLMQVTPDTASGVVFLAKKAGLLSADLRAELLVFLGERLACIERQHYMNEPVRCNTAISRAELLNPALNILIGSMLLALLVAQHTENGVIRLDKVICRYNRGYFYKPKGTIQELLASAPAETKAYILKLVGVNSTLDMLTT
jgi:soluble lytic murein transglycosylase-like protein